MEIIKKISTTHFEKGDIKNQILLTHTSRNIIDYMVSLKYRFGGNPHKLPHYLISREGKVIQLLNNELNGNFSNNDRVNAKSIVISLENFAEILRMKKNKKH